MPLTEKGASIKKAMEENYGKEKGEEVFYASANKGTITGVDDMEEPETDAKTPEQMARSNEARRAARSLASGTIQGMSESELRSYSGRNPNDPGAGEWARKELKRRGLRTDSMEEPELDAETKHDPHSGQFTSGGGGGGGGGSSGGGGEGPKPVEKMSQGEREEELGNWWSENRPDEEDITPRGLGENAPQRIKDLVKHMDPEGYAEEFGDAGPILGTGTAEQWQQSQKEFLAKIAEENAKRREAYARRQAAKLSGGDEMEEQPEEDCNDSGIMAPMPAMSPIPTPALSPADGTFGGVVDSGFGRDQTPVMPPVPMPSTQHPQLHPDASAPPEPAIGGRDAAAGYGGVAGGVIPQEFGDRGLGDALPTQVTHNEICRQGEQFWGPQWGGTE